MMIKINKINFLFVFIFLFFFLNPAYAQLDKNLTLTITPPLIKNNLQPGESWASTIKVVNNNTHPLDVYTDVMDFKSGKEGGVELFNSAKDSGDIDTTANSIFLSRWLDVKEGPITIEALKSAEIPFSISVPQDATPGGHYAAILAGTKPIDGEKKGVGLKISSMLSSLVLINVAGDIVEDGKIREFSSERVVYEKPEVSFNVRFQNNGNVHLQPIGEVKVFNMFGDLKDSLPINHNTQFGNVLPNSTRKWNVVWSDKKTLLNMGRYKADLILSFGESAKTTDTMSTYFWVIDFKILGIIGGTFLFLIILLYLVIKWSIRRAVKSARKQLGIEDRTGAVFTKSIKAEEEKKGEIKKAKPRSKQIIDLKSKIKDR